VGKNSVIELLSARGLRVTVIRDDLPTDPT